MLYKKDLNEERKQELMDATVRIIAENGLENTATNMICSLSGINVAYIYRLFESKEDLIAKTFDKADTEFLNTIIENFPVLKYDSIDYEMRCRVLFMKCWNFVMERPQELTFYVRYYYSSSFQKYSYSAHMQRYTVLIEKMKTAFPETVDVRAVLHHILDTLLGEAMKQISDPHESNEKAAEKSFQLIFSVVKAYIKSEKIKAC